MATNLFALGLLLSIFAGLLPTSIEKSIGPTTKTTKSSAGICQLPQKAGLCMGNFPRWSFSHKTTKCQQFIYGGCGGNQNNFLSQKECLYTCRSGSQQAVKPPVVIAPTTKETRKKTVDKDNTTIQHHPTQQKTKTDPPIYTKPCEVEKRKALASNKSGSFVPECSQNGDYTAKQCWKPLGMKYGCWCVNLQGNKIGEVRIKKNGKQTCKPIKKRESDDTICRQIIDTYHQTLPQKVLSRLYMPQCDYAGHFIPLQCHKDNCWCVDVYFGNKIKNTSGKKGLVKCTN